MKRAYRQRVRNLHPDTATGNVVKFMEVQKAWRMVEAATRTGIPAYTPDPGAPSASTVAAGDPTDDGAHPTHQPFAPQPGVTKQGLRLTYTLALTSEEALAGGSRRILLTYPLACGDCKGVGTHVSTKACTSCHGAGRHHSQAPACSTCTGDGYARETCAPCGGRSYLPHEAAHTISWPGGTGSGVLRLPRQGGPGYGNGAPGDLNITTVVR
jgi:DnaJ-class molecular chaperone